jgi:hypothetical protein
MTDKEILTADHNLLNELTFRFKASVLIIIRFLINSFHGTTRFPSAELLKNEHVIAVSETDLWNPDDNEQNWILTAGKIQNLRTAARCLHGIEVPADEIFSFWKHVGAPVARRGYVVGREIREGCIVPAIAGGLCQLSNALYDNALKSGCEIIERHRHTKVVKGSLAELDRDATVKWNYIDLRFRSNHAFRIEVELTSDKLVVTFRSPLRKKNDEQGQPGRLIPPSKLNDCYSCGNVGCFKHPDKSGKNTQTSTTAFILNERWKEYDEHVKTIAEFKDTIVLPSFADRLTRSFLFRLAAGFKRNIFSTSLHLDRLVARKMAKRIPTGSNHIVVSQNLLPFIWEEGALGGRTFDVVMTRLPIEKLHERLDLAHKKYPQSATLNDFRAGNDLIDLENIALTKARHVITPHDEIARIFVHKSIKLDWACPAPARGNKIGTKVLFPGSALARKGAYEMRQLARELNLQVVVLGNATEDPSFWDGLNVERPGADPFDNVQLIVYPVYVEHQPRILLKAIASGIPVVTTTASGISESDHVAIVPIGDFELLKDAVVKTLRQR